MRELLGRTLHDAGLVLESTLESEGRLLRVLELLGNIVPYERCALLETQPGRHPRLLVLPAKPPDIRAALAETCELLRRQFVDERARRFETLPTERGAHLAVPLLDDRQAMGLVYVSRGEGHDGSVTAYTDQHLRELSVVGALLAGYLSRMRQASALEEARREAESANRVRDELLALVSHELKTPLSSTLAWIRVLRLEEAGQPARARALTGIERNVVAQVALIDEVLDLASIVADDLRLHFEAVEAASLIEAAVVEQRPRAERTSISLETVLDGSVQRLVVDRMRIVQVVSNVLANVIRLAPSGGRIAVTLERVGVRARICVWEHRGRGPAPSAGPHAPAAACTAPNPLSEACLGRGFAIAKALVEAHGGYIRAEGPGEDKSGAITIELPLPVEEPAMCEPMLVGVHVLLVDDNDDMRIAVGAVLEHEGAEVRGVASAAEALAVLESSWPHVLLTDLSLRGESGYDLMRKVAVRHATLPSAALTAFGTDEDRQRTRAAGFRMHLTKPLDFRALVAAVAILSGRPLAGREPGRVAGADGRLPVP